LKKARKIFSCTQCKSAREAICTCQAPLALKSQNYFFCFLGLRFEKGAQKFFMHRMHIWPTGDFHQSPNTSPSVEYYFFLIFKFEKKRGAKYTPWREFSHFTASFSRIPASDPGLPWTSTLTSRGS
jgi:hypothetical protein